MSAIFLPPPSLQARFDESVLRRSALKHLPAWEQQEAMGPSRRSFLAAAGVALASFSPIVSAGPKSFEPPTAEELAARAEQPVERSAVPLKRGEIPPDFWSRPRELWVQMQNSSEQARVVYWADGQLQAEGYWKLCALLRDRHANVMTAVDPVLLDVLRGVYGFYQAWEYHKPIVATSAYRTLKTNERLRTGKEKAALNSMHLYGKACDLFIEGVRPQDIGNLGRHLQQGGVGYYPSRGFTHLDTGRLRAWRG